LLIDWRSSTEPIHAPDRVKHVGVQSKPAQLVYLTRLSRFLTIISRAWPLPFLSPVRDDAAAACCSGCCRPSLSPPHASVAPPPSPLSTPTLSLAAALLSPALATSSTLLLRRLLSTATGRLRRRRGGVFAHLDGIYNLPLFDLIFVAPHCRPNLEP
jgi:hypothetical protein